MAGNIDLIFSKVLLTALTNSCWGWMHQNKCFNGTLCPLLLAVQQHVLFVARLAQFSTQVHWICFCLILDLWFGDGIGVVLIIRKVFREFGRFKGTVSVAFMFEEILNFIWIIFKVWLLKISKSLQIAALFLFFLIKGKNSIVDINFISCLWIFQHDAQSQIKSVECT